MADFRILQLEIDGEYYYVRRETVGSSTIDAAAGYRSKYVIAHFQKMRDSKTRPTRMDKVAGKANTIRVTILRLLSNCDNATADAAKAEEVAKLRDAYPGKVINQR